MTTPSGTPTPQQPTPAPATPASPAAPAQQPAYRTPGTTPAQAAPTGGSAVDGLVRTATGVAGQALSQVAKVLEGTKPKLGGAADKIGHVIERQTGRRYDAQVHRAAQWVEKGIDAVVGTAAKASAGAPAAPSATAPSPAPAASTPSVTPTPATSTTPAAPATPTTPAAPAKPAEGWHRGPDGQWVRS